MAGIYGITANDVRRVSGLNLDDIVDTDVDAFIPQAEKEVERLACTVFLPKTTFMSFSGDGGRSIRLGKTPILSVVSIKSDGTTVTPSKIRVSPLSGIVTLSTDAEVSVWNTHFEKKNHIKYTYGKMQESTTETTTTSAVSAGSNIVVAVSSSTGITATSYVKIHGMDGYEEVVQVSSVAGNNLTIGTLNYSHESGSRVVLMQTPLEVKRAIAMVAAIMTSMYKIGGTNDFQTGYELGDLRVQKGEPYPPFDRLLTDLEHKAMALINGFKQTTIV